MELISIQSLTLLTTIIAVVSNLLSINEKISSNGLVNTLKLMSYYVLPIIFLKQIIIFNYEVKSLLTIFLSIIPISTLIVVKKNKIKFYSSEDTVFIYTSFILLLILILQIFIPCIGIENYNSQITDYINEIKVYKISIAMYQYMMEYLFCTLCLIIDVVETILFFMVSFKELIYYNQYIFDSKNNIISINYDTSIDFEKMVINMLVLFFLAGFGKQTINYIIGLF